MKCNDVCTRRELAGWGLAGLGIGFLRTEDALGGESKSSRIFRPGDRVDVAGKEMEIIKQAYQLGYDYEKRYGGCAQCVLAALQDALPFVEKNGEVFRAAGCLDGGATPTGLQNCGSFTGAGMVIGLLCARVRNGDFQGNNEFAHQLIRKLYQRFEAHYGSVLCKDVRAKAKADCPHVVGSAAKWTAEILLEALADYRAQEPPPPSPTPKSSESQPNAPSSPAPKGPPK